MKIRDTGHDLASIIGDPQRHVWDSSAEPPTIKQNLKVHPLARKAVKVKREQKAGK
jgi:hypothetical protein